MAVVAKSRSSLHKEKCDLNNPVLNKILYLVVFSLYFFFNWDSLHARHGVTTKRSTNRLEHTGNLFRKNFQLKDVCQF